MEGNDRKENVKMLQDLTDPKQLHNLTDEQLQTLCQELRQEILHSVSQNGGHLASNLGFVETTVALHRSFNTPEDQIVFDVGHQSYAHKLLTGRYQGFTALRQQGGVSGFTSPEESAYDTTFAGHSGTAISTALGLATANRMQGKDNYAIAVIGDGSFTNGMVYEALNNCAGQQLKLIIVLNDNDMSISKNVGNIPKYLYRVRYSHRYQRLKNTLKTKFADRKIILKGLMKIHNFFKRRVYHENMFEQMGMHYIGPVNGNSVAQTEHAFSVAKLMEGVTIVHVVTQKGLGYTPAQEQPSLYHGVSPFDVQLGVQQGEDDSFSAQAGQVLCDLAGQDKKLCAITAAMADGVGLSAFAKQFPDRFFDVGIAEEHAVTFASGLARNGYTPVCMLYSTFSQRVFDQLFHDVVVQKLPLVLLLDRCGFVAGDGVTHQGLMDVSLFSTLPDTQIFAPNTYAELKQMLADAVQKRKGLTIIRYPRGKQTASLTAQKEGVRYNALTGKVAVVTYGRVLQQVQKAVELLGEDGQAVSVLQLTRLYPLDTALLSSLLAPFQTVLFVEEGMQSGGVGERLFAECLCGKRVNTQLIAVSGLVGVGSNEQLYAQNGMDSQAIAQAIKKWL